MKSIKHNKNWTAEPNAPNIQLQIDGDEIVMEMTLNSTLFEHIDTDERGLLRFETVYAYRKQEMNEQAYNNGAFRFKNNQLAWGGFYELSDSAWAKTFPEDAIILNASANKKGLRHFICLLPTMIFECIASEYSFKYGNLVDELLDEKYPKGYLNHYIAMFASQFDEPSTDNFMIYTDLYIQMEGKKEFDALKSEIKRIKANDDVRLYLKFANNYDITNFGLAQLNDMLRVIESFK